MAFPSTECSSIDAIVSNGEPTSVDTVGMATMTSEQRKLLEEAVRRGADIASGVETKIVRYGRWLLASVFGGNPSEALDPKTRNAVWLALVRRAGGPKLPMSSRMLSVALRIAAWDRCIDDVTWRSLDAGRKELLLPLHDAELLARAAHHVSKFDLTHAKTTEYLAELRAAEGRRPVSRMTAPILIARIKRFRTGVASRAILKKVRRLRESLEPAQRTALAEEIDRVRADLVSLSRLLRTR